MAPEQNTCKICTRNPATVPESATVPRYCTTCWDQRLKQLYKLQDQFRSQRAMRTTEAEKYFAYHEAVKDEDGLCAVIFCMHDNIADHLDVSAYLLPVLPWDEKVAFIYPEGVEMEVELVDVFLSFVEGDLISGWRCRSWTMEITRCAPGAFWVDSADRDAGDNRKAVEED